MQQIPVFASPSTGPASPWSQPEALLIFAFAVAKDGTEMDGRSSHLVGEEL